MKLPISGRMKAAREFVDLAFFLLILRRSGLHVFGHGSALSRSATLPPPSLVPMRNAAVGTLLLLSDTPMARTTIRKQRFLSNG
jgi:hypothetical protein